MGLDMYLRATTYASNNSYFKQNPEVFDEVLQSVELTPDDLDSEMLSMTISIPVMYWRKANAIHNWFVRNVQNGDDDCKPYWVSREQLKELLQICNQIQLEPEKASELLPSQAGFFFGTTDYDESYMNDIKRTSNALVKYLYSPRFKNFEFEYQSSW